MITGDESEISILRVCALVNLGSRSDISCVVNSESMLVSSCWEPMMMLLLCIVCVDMISV